MCEPVKAKRSGSEAAAELATFMQRELQLTHLDSAELRLCLKLYWSKIAKLAHEIHDGD